MSSFIPIICGKFRTLNKEILLEAIFPTNIKEFIIDDEMKRLDLNEDYTRIFEDIFVNIKNCLFSIELNNRIIRDFDWITGTNVFESIMFETK